MIFPTKFALPAKLFCYFLIGGCMYSANAQQANTVAQPIVIQQKSALESLKSVDCPNFAQLVTVFQEKFTKKMRLWSEQHLETLAYQTVFYPFSGPDAVTVMGLFPRANYFVLVADQKPEYEDLEEDRVVSSQIQEFECQMLARYAHSGFYLTNDLIGKNGPKPRFIKLLIYNLAFAQAQILDMKTLFVTEDGKILLNTPGKEPAGIRFELLTKEGKPVSLDYLYANISDNGLKNYLHYQKAFARKSSQMVFIKSASHLLQKPYFSTLQTILLQNAKVIVQDETGLDIERLDQNFTVRLFGKFQKPHNLWANSESAKRLASYYENHPSLDQLPFHLGYEKQAGSILMIALKK